MTTDVKDEVTEMPTLTFGAFDGDNAAAVPAPVPAQTTVQAAAPDMMKEAVLSAEEMKAVDAFASKIDLDNSQAIMSYGAGTQKKMADFSENALERVRTKDMDEIGDMITSLVGDLKNFDVEEQNKGILSFFRKSANSLTLLKAKYNKVEANVATITDELEKHQIQLMKDIDLLDHMYDQNLNYFKELTMYILAGKKKLQDVRNSQLTALQQKAAQTAQPEDAQAARDLAAKCDRFEKKLYDLELTRTISMQTAPQIRMVQGSDTMMAEKIQSTIVNTIPLWKSQMVIAIGVEHANQAAKAQREVSDMTNELLRKNADALKTATVESAKESERGIVDIETLKHTNETLISTLDEVLTIQTDGKAKRQAAETELAGMEDQLKAKLLEASQTVRGTANGQ